MTLIESRPVDDFPIELACDKCGKKFTLWYNGGELDKYECCHVTYEVFATGHVLEISDDDPGPDPDPRDTQGDLQFHNDREEGRG